MPGGVDKARLASSRTSFVHVTSLRRYASRNECNSTDFRLMNSRGQVMVGRSGQRNPGRDGGMLRISSKSLHLSPAPVFVRFFRLHFPQISNAFLTCHTHPAYVITNLSPALGESPSNEKKEAGRRPVWDISLPVTRMWIACLDENARFMFPARGVFFIFCNQR